MEAFSPPEYFKSVHQSGVGAAKEKQEQREQEYRQWRSKLVVDDPRVRVHWGGQGNGTHPLNRLEPLLKDAPMRPGLLPKRVKPVEAAPLSIFTEGQWQPPGEFDRTLRPTEKARWVSSRPYRPVVRAGGSKLHTRPIPQLSEAERSSLLFVHGGSRDGHNSTEGGGGGGGGSNSSSPSAVQPT